MPKSLAIRSRRVKVWWNGFASELIVLPKPACSGLWSLTKQRFFHGWNADRNLRKGKATVPRARLQRPEIARRAPLQTLTCQLRERDCVRGSTRQLTGCIPRAHTCHQTWGNTFRGGCITGRHCRSPVAHSKKFSSRVNTLRNSHSVGCVMPHSARFRGNVADSHGRSMAPGRRISRTTCCGAISHAADL